LWPDHLPSGNQNEPEKYNLYRGLSELAGAIKRLEHQFSLIKATINHIDRKVG
jgi:hypothetical protein